MHAFDTVLAYLHCRQLTEAHPMMFRYPSITLVHFNLNHICEGISSLTVHPLYNIGLYVYLYTADSLLRLTPRCLGVTV